MDCQDCGQANPESARFCNECGVRLGAEARPAPIARQPINYTPRHLTEQILTMRASLVGERKFVTVFFADVVGSMALAEQLGPEPWHRLMDQFFRILGESIHRLGGTINQFTGDGVMALFGAPIALEDHAQRACHAALEIFDALGPLDAAIQAEHGIPFSTRIGLNSGDVVVGKIGDDLRMDYTAQGHAVGLAARVERLAEPGSTCLTANTAKLVDGYFELSNLGDHTLHGSQAPVTVYGLVGTGALQTRLDHAGAAGFSPLVGRESGLASLQRAFDESGLVVGIEGPAGIGKSRLALEFAERCQSRGVPVYRTHCSSLGQSVPWLPIQGLLADYFELGETTDDDANRIARDPIFAAPELASALPSLLELLGLDIAGVDPDNVGRSRVRPPASESDRRDEIIAVLVALIRARSAHSPSVILIDDLHWIDEESAIVLEAMVDAVSSSRILLLLNFRSDDSDYRADWMNSPHYRQIGLLPLGPETGHTLLDALIGDDLSLDALRKRILHDTGGNPLFIEELVRALVETDRLSGTPGAYQLLDPDTPLEIPATLQPILAARIDRLSDTDKSVLQIASVIGLRFERAILEQVSQLHEDVVAAAIQRLEAGQFIQCRNLHPNAPWVFHHVLIRDVAYHSLLQERRENLHAAVATAIEASGEPLGQRANLIAYHWEAANRAYQARRWKMRATLRVTHIQPRRH